MALVHFDNRLRHYAKAVLDEVFGREAMRNETVRYYNSGARTQHGFGKRHNLIFRYGKSDTAIPSFDDRGQGIVESVRVPYGPDINIPASEAHYYDPDGKVRDHVWEIPIPGQNDKKERTGYPAQKPERLLDLRVAAFLRTDDVVADSFCGSGTTAAVAEKLGRTWIVADLGKFAIHTTRKRMIGVRRQLKAEGKDYHAFEILNLGKYERQHYIGVNPNLREAEQQKQLEEKEAAFADLILRAYRAERTEGFTAFHGKKAGWLVAVGPINLPVTRLYVEKVILECRKETHHSRRHPRFRV